MKQRPPISSDVQSLGEALGSPARDVRAGGGDGWRLGGVVADFRRRGLFEVRANGATGDQESGQRQRPSRDQRVWTGGRATRRAARSGPEHGDDVP